MRFRPTIPTLALAGLLALPQPAQAVTEGFDSGQGVWDKASTLSQLEYRGTGGNPGGYMMFSGTSKIGLSTRSAPFVGDYAAAGYDEIRVDLNVQLMQITNFKPKVYIRHSPAVAAWTYKLADFTPTGGVWQRLAAPLDAAWSDDEARAAGWTQDEGTSFSFAETMAQVWGVGIRLDYVLTVPAFIGVDNFTVHKKPQASAPMRRKGGDKSGRSGEALRLPGAKP